MFLTSILGNKSMTYEKETSANDRLRSYDKHPGFIAIQEVIRSEQSLVSIQEHHRIAQIFQSSMSKFWILLLITFCLRECVPSKWSSEQVCGKASSSSRTVKLSVNSWKNESNEWVDTFNALAETSDSATRMDVDLTHTVFQCDKKRSVVIEGITNAPPSLFGDDSLHFHIRCGKNAAIMDKGQSAQKISNDDPFHSQLFTHRPLRNGEIFEVKLENKNTKFSYSLGIGIIMRSPDSVDILPEMWKSPVAWIYHHGKIYNSAAEKVHNYARDINQLQVGERIGVMRTEFGTLHFFINGVDQGPAASNIPSPVYGLVELWYNTMKVSIVN